MYELKSEKDLDALALKRHPIELDSDGFANYFKVGQMVMERL